MTKTASIAGSYICLHLSCVCQVDSEETKDGDSQKPICIPKFVLLFSHITI